MKPPNTTDAERFWSKVDRATGEASCWLWKASLSRHGYGRIPWEGRSQTASRVAWMITRGPLCEDEGVLHRCDNPRCVRPDHLFLGTPAANSTDMVAKHRQTFGQRNAMAKLSDEAVKVIRARVGGGESMSSVARVFAVHPSLVSMVCARKIWRHVA